MKIINEAYRAHVGECPLWDDVNDTLWYIDILGKCIFGINYKTEQTQSIYVKQKVGSIALCENNGLLIAMEDGIYRMSADGAIRLAHQPIKMKGERFNDGKVGPDGCFYVGTADASASGAFYRLRGGVLEELFDGCTCSNGLDWSRDTTKLFYCDTPLQKIEVFDFDKSIGSLDNRRTFVEIPREMGGPDGFAMDESDHIWLGLWNGSRIVEVRADGSFGESISVPARKVSCCCFAGAALNELIITTASKEDAEEYPLSGYTFATKAKTKGKRAFRYKG